MLTSLLFIADGFLVARWATSQALWFSPWCLYFLFTALRIVLYNCHMPQTAVFMTMLALVFQLYCTQDIVKRLWHELPQPIVWAWIIAVGVGALLLAFHDPYPTYPPVLYYTHACLQLSMFAAVFVSVLSYDLLGGNVGKEVLWQSTLWMLYMGGCLVSDAIPAPVYAPLATKATGIIHLFCFAGWYWQDVSSSRA